MGPLLVMSMEPDEYGTFQVFDEGAWVQMTPARIREKVTVEGRDLKEWKDR